MHTDSVKVLVPPAIQAPRGALWAANAAAWLVQLASGARLRNGAAIRAVDTPSAPQAAA